MKLIEKILSLPKTLLFNFYYLPFKDAVKLPIIVSYKVKIGSLGNKKGLKILNSQSKISVGFVGSFALGKSGYWELGKNASVTFRGSASLGRGIQFICNGEMLIGDNFWCNSDCILNAKKKIYIGDDVLLGWNSVVLDGDGHYVYPENTNREQSVVIGNHVWLSSYTMILKGSKIEDDCVVAAKGCISKPFNKKNLLIGGFNKVLREHITWEL